MQQHLKDTIEIFEEAFLISESGHFLYSESSPRIYVEPIGEGFLVWHENYPSSKIYAETIWEAPRILLNILEPKLITLQNDIVRLEK